MQVTKETHNKPTKKPSIAKGTSERKSLALNSEETRPAKTHVTKEEDNKRGKGSATKGSARIGPDDKKKYWTKVSRVIRGRFNAPQQSHSVRKSPSKDTRKGLRNANQDNWNKETQNRDPGCCEPRDPNSKDELKHSL